jgi:hypothetical protein
MRLIDGDKLQEFPIRANRCDKEHANEHFINGIETVLEYAEQLPTVDAEVVVRCKDSKYYKESRVLAPNKFCFRLNHPTEPGKIGYNFADNDFCSRGVRRNEGRQ